MSKRKREIRNKFRLSVFERDNYKCRKCDHEWEELDPLDAHHIIDRNEMPDGGYILSNGISLCERCHLKAEKYHQTSGEEWVEGFHPDELSKLVNG